MPDPTAPEPLIDPDCNAGKHGSCVGDPCECMCHDVALVDALLGSDPDYLGGQSVDDYIREARRDV